MRIGNNDVLLKDIGMSPDWIYKDGKRHLMQEVEVMINGQFTEYDITLEIVVPTTVSSVSSINLDKDSPKIVDVFLTRWNYDTGSYFSPIAYNEEPDEIGEIKNYLLNNFSDEDWEEFIR